MHILFHIFWPEVLCSATFDNGHVHATAPCSAHSLAQAHPTMSYIPLVIIGVNMSKPHTSGENGKLSVYIYIYIWYVHIPYMHFALFLRNAIFPHVIQSEERRRERLRHSNQHDRDRRTAEGTVSREETKR